MKIYRIHPAHVVEVAAWCHEVFGPAYCMPHWWRIEKLDDEYDIPLNFEINILNDDDAALYVLRWK